MPIYLVRHAHAGSRREWRGDDSDRPLTERGLVQAQDLKATLDGHDLGEIWTSPSLRCTQTVEPLAEQRGLDVVRQPLLAEGASPGEALDWLLERSAQNPVACSHGDVIPVVIRLAVGRGMDATPGGDSKKGSIWVIHVEDGMPKVGTYVAPRS